MNSIEWFADEVFKTLNYHYEGKLPAVIAGLKISEAKHKAIEMYKNEMTTNCNKHVTDNHTLKTAFEILQSKLTIADTSEFRLIHIPEILDAMEQYKTQK